MNWIVSQVSDPHKFRRLNGALAIFWALMLPISAIFGLINSVAYIALLSIYALFAAHLSGWAAARTEARQVEEAAIVADHADIKADDVTVTKGDQHG